MKYKYKQSLAILLAGTMFLSCGMTVFADRNDAVLDQPFLALGADLNASEQATVLQMLGLDDADLSQYDVITITNADEHAYLDSYLDSSVIGSRALSSVLVVGKEVGNGIQVTTKNISYCTEGMYQNALITAGLEDADITVAGPFSISGTAALVGAIKAYETMTGENVSDASMDAANNELVLTGELVDVVGDSDKVEELIALVKQEVAENDIESEDDIMNIVNQACEQMDISLSDSDQQKITDLMGKINNLDLDVSEIKSQAQELYNKLDELDFNVDKESVGNFLTEIVNAITSFLQNIFG